MTLSDLWGTRIDVFIVFVFYLVKLLYPLPPIFFAGLCLFCPISRGASTSKMSSYYKGMRWMQHEYVIG